MVAARPLRSSPHPHGADLLHDPAVFALDAMSEAPEAVTGFLERVQVRQRLGAAPRVLDVACGTGQRLAPLQALGWSVTGREEDRRLRSAARLRCPPEVSVQAGGLLDLEAQGCFDMILAWDGALAYLPGLGHRMRALRRQIRALRPGGVLVLGLPNLLWSLVHGLPDGVDSASPAPGVRVIRQRMHVAELDLGVVRRRDRYRIEGSDLPYEEVELLHDLSIVTAQELAHGLRQAGFSRVETWAGLDAVLPGPLDGPDMVVVARR